MSASISWSTRSTITVGTWNVRTMFEAGKTAQVAAEMSNYNLTDLEISGQGGQVPVRGGLPQGSYCCVQVHEEDNATHTQGVALMMSKTAQGTLTGWEAHGPRILKATFQIQKPKINMEVIQRYAPTHDSNADIKKVLQHTVYYPPKLPKTKHYHHDGRLQC